jgi:hypothetical protein
MVDNIETKKYSKNHLTNLKPILGIVAPKKQYLQNL